MNYCKEEQEYAEYQSQVSRERQMNPCDVSDGVYMLVDDASPNEGGLYFRSLRGAYTWAQNTNDFSHGEWSVYEIGGKVL